MRTKLNQNLALKQAIRTVLTGSLLLAGFSSSAYAALDNQYMPSNLIHSGPVTFNTGDLVVTSSYYQGTVNSIVPGTTTLSGTNATTHSTAVADSSYLNVWNNGTVDASFGVTSSIIISDLKVNGTTATVEKSYDLTAIAANQGVNLVTSFASKSELSVNLSTDSTALTLNGYSSTVGKLDVSNSNTPGVIDATNPSIAASTYRSVAQINLNGSLEVTNTNAYSGNNGRASILDNSNNTYIMVGNAGNSGKPAPAASFLNTLSDNTGVQTITAGSSNPNTQVIGKLTADGQHGFSVSQTNPLTGQPYGPSDKVGKDDNFRSETIFNNTLYVTKGSGGNGINTVYQVGDVGGVHNINANSTITVLPGLPTVLASNPTNYPFGIWFANDHTLFVADEGAGGTIAKNAAAAASNGQAGLEEWVLDTATKVWHEAHVWQAGLGLGISYTVPGINGQVGYTAATDGLRELTGKVNADGSYTLYATTSTISNSGDQGADTNKLVGINIASNTTGNEQFVTLETAAYGQVLRGVSLAPVPEPEQWAMLLLGLPLVAVAGKRRGKKSA